MAKEEQQKMTTESNEVKVRFRLEPANKLGLQSEDLWAERMGPDRFRILNSPFFVFGVNAEDVVSAESVGGLLEFRDVQSRGGHSTYRLFLQNGRTIRDSDFLDLWQPISNLGATFENANSHFVAVDIPPGKRIGDIYKLMEKGEELGVWAFEEAHYEPGS